MTFRVATEFANQEGSGSPKFREIDCFDFQVPASLKIFLLSMSETFEWHLRVSCKCHFQRQTPSNECELDVNVMARIRPTVTADEDDHENVKMEGPFVPRNFPRASRRARIEKRRVPKGVRQKASGGWEKEGGKEREREREKINQIESVSRGALA